MSTDQHIFESQGFGHGLVHGPGYGLLIVDFVNGFVSSDSFGGFNTASAATNTLPVLKKARDAGWAVAHTRIVYSPDGADANVFSEKVPSVLKLTEGNPDSHIIETLTPHPGELVACKTAPSAFFGTAVLTYLIAHQVKTLLIAGATTSGCVRASVVDAMSFGFKPVVLRDCVGDRVKSAHVSSLRDMQMKYADVLDAREFFEQLKR